MAKRKFEPESIEIEIADINRTISAATLHGVVINVSPMKKGEKNSSVNYFDGEISDGTNKLRFISFNSKLRPNIEKSFNESSTIQLVNCQIKESSYIGQLNQYEILLSTKTQINESTKTEV